MSPWGYGDGGDSRNSCPPISVAEERSLSNGCPRLTDVRDEEKSTFVEKCEMGSKFSGFFLYWATCVSSTGQWLLRFSLRHDVLASAMSILSSSLSATHGQDDSGLRNVSRSICLSVAESTNPWNILLPAGLAPTGATACVSALAIIEVVVRGLALVGAPPFHRSDSFEPSAQPNSMMRLALQPQIDTFCPPSTRPRHVVSVIPVVEEFHRVSCLIL
jgi:hypothetical protein